MLLTGNPSKDDAVSDTESGYLRYRHRKILFLLSLGLMLVALCMVTMVMGSTDLSLWEIITYLLHPDGSWESTVVWDLRFRMVVAAILAGSALGIAGCVMQSILRNPLASPFTLGLSNASAFGASMAILFLEGGTVVGSVSAYVNVSSPILVTVFAFVFAMVATGVMLLLVKLTACTPETIVLAGLAISSIFSAGLAFMQYIANDVALSAIVFWQFGSLSKVSWDSLTILLAVTVAVVSYFLIKRWDYNALEAGEDVAHGLGVNVRRTRLIGLIMAAVLTAVTVSFMGIIGFIGLIGPHLVKRVVGNDNRFVLMGSMLMGSLILLMSYIVGSFAFSTVVPVGIITSAIGGPIFIYILIRGHRRKCSV